MHTNALMRLLLCAFLKDQDHPRTVNTLHGLDRFREVIEYIRENLHTQITIDQLADLVDLNPTYFSNLFARLMGTPPIQYVNRRRIEKAQQLLLSGHEPLHDIAARVGLTDVYYFSRLFKKIVGIAPSLYRRQRLL